MITPDRVRNDDVARTYIMKADRVMDAIGYTEHGLRHVLVVSEAAQRVLVKLTGDTRRGELAAIAGLLHDIGNVAGREGHPQSGAILAGRILTDMGMHPEEVCDIMAAIGNHEAHPELIPELDLCAALVIADKADVHHTRVRPTGSIENDIHDRVNAAADSAELKVNAATRVISLAVRINPEVSTPMEYFEIFLERMVCSRHAAEILEAHFELYINEARLS
jgi:uncharacterized protein